MNGDSRTLHAIRGPLTLITLGVLFALNNFTPYRFSETWPVLLIVFGALSLVARGSGAPAPPPFGYPPPPARPGDPGTQPPPGEHR
jgi:cell wall-active antibiotic response 4TMS protein YvqF